MAQLMAQGKQQYFDDNGGPLSGGKLWTYAAGTTTPLATYSDAAGSTPNTNPVVLNARGEATIFWAAASYKAVLTDASDVTIWTQDNISTPLADLSGTGGSALVGFSQAVSYASGTVGAALKRVVSVTDAPFGATGDGVTDDTAALNSTFLSGATKVFGGHGDTYLTNDTVTLPAGVDLDMSSSEIWYDGPDDRPAFVIGASGAATVGSNIKLPKIKYVATRTWANDANVGVRAYNLQGCTVESKHIEGFQINYQAFCDVGTGYAYNRHFMTLSFDARYHIDLFSNGTSCFINENDWHVGDLQNTSSYPAANDTYGIRFAWNGTTGYRLSNQNIFYKPCFQLLDGDAGTTRVPILFDGAGRSNRFHDIRHESGRGPLAICDGGGTANIVTGNTFELGLQVGSVIVAGITEQDSAQDNLILAQKEQGRTRPAWHSGNLVDLISPYANDGSYVSGDVSFFANSATPTKVISSASAIDVRWQDVSFTGAALIGVCAFVDTSSIKKLSIRHDAPSTNPGRLQVQCFDTSGAVLTNAGGGHPYAVGPALAYAAGNGGVYQTQNDSSMASGEALVTVGPDVAYVRIGFVAGTAALILSSFSIIGFPEGAQAGALSVWSGVNDDTAARLATTKPDAATGRVFGRFARGDMVRNAAVAAAAPSHWSCSVAGARAALWAINTVYVAEQVRENGANVYVCRTGGTSAGSGGPTGTGTAIADNTVTWDFLAPVAVFVTSGNMS